MIHDGLLFSIAVLGCCAATLRDNICIRNEKEIQIKLNSTARINLHRGSKFYDTHFLEVMARSSVYVDKTLLINEIFKINKKVILITNPPGTGKSMNLEMLKSFFEIRVKKPKSVYDKAIKLMPPHESSTYKFFTTGVFDATIDAPLQPNDDLAQGSKYANPIPNARYTNPPIISKYQNIIEKHLSQHPVILMRFRSQYFRLKNITSSLTEYVCDVFKKHVFLRGIIRNIVKHKDTSKADKKRAREVIDILLYYYGHCHYGGHELDFLELENSMAILAQIMKEFLSKRVIILIDDYIETLRYYLTESDYCLPVGQYEKDVRQGVQVLKNFFKKTFNSPDVRKVILTGVLSVNTSDLFADVFEFLHCNVIDNRLQEFYGFKENEMNALLNHFEIDTEMQNDTKQLYKGSITTPSISLHTYNTWSVVNFLNQKKLDRYFVRYKTMFRRVSSLLDMKKLSNILTPLINGDKKLIHFVESNTNLYMENLNLDVTVLPIGDISSRIRAEFYVKKSLLIWENATYTEEDVNRVLSWLCEMGYLTANGGEPAINGRNGSNIYVQFFSKEIRHAFKRWYRNNIES